VQTTYLRLLPESARPGVEPVTFQSQVQCATITPPDHTQRSATYFTGSFGTFPEQVLEKRE